MNKKRIGILTFHRAHNYGAVLQCYALQEFLRSIGHDAFVIDYNNPDLWAYYDWYKHEEVKACFQKFRKIPKRIIKLMIKWCKIIPRYIRFRRFQEYKLQIVPTSTIFQHPFDVIFIGSDQVWNLGITHGFDEYYWGTFARPQKSKVATYGASLKEYWKESDIEMAIINIKSLSAVSVREPQLANFLQSQDSELHPVVVPDPVFLLSKEEWSSRAVKPKIKQPYVLFYQAMDNEEVFKTATEIALKEKKQLVVLSANVNGRNSAICRSASPFEFIGWIKYADLIVTSSFHATAFSILFQKPFYCVNLNMGHDSRLLDVLKDFNLSEHWINSSTECEPLPVFNPQMELKRLKEIAYGYVDGLTC